MAIAINQIAAGPPPVDPGLARIYRESISDLTKLLRRRKGVSEFSRQRARALLKQSTEILERLDNQAAQWIAQNVPKSYLRGIRVAELGFGEIGVAGRSAVQPLIHQEAIQVLVNDLQADLVETTVRLERGFRKLVTRTQLEAIKDRAITKSVAKGIVKGSARRKVSREIRENILSEFLEKGITINGRTYDAGKYAELVARTKTREAQSAGTVNRVIDSGHDLVMVTAHGAKDGCGPFEGKVFSVSGTSDVYPALSSLPNGGPPFHPN